MGLFKKKMPIDADAIREITKLILREYPDSRILQEGKIDMAVFPKQSIEIDFSKFPNQPKFRLSKALERFVPDVQRLSPKLRDWDAQSPPNLLQIILAIERSLEMVAGVHVYIDEELMYNLLEIAQNEPAEVLFLLQMSEGLITDYLMAPGLAASEVSAVFYSSRVKSDASIIGSIHSHPRGHPFPSQADLQTFRQKPINIIIGAGFSLLNTKAYNMKGEPIQYTLL